MWGENIALFNEITRLKLYLDTNWPTLKSRPTRWLIAPDARGANPLLAWTQADHPETIFLANTSLEKPSRAFGVPLPGKSATCQLEFSTHEETPADDQVLVSNGLYYPVTTLAPAEGRVYKINT